MAITISGENNNDKILASDGVIDSLSSLNIAGIATATTFVGNLTGNVTGNVTGDVGGNLTGNVTGNINNTTLLLQTGGYERVHIKSDGNVGIGTDNPTEKLVVNGEVKVFGSDGTGYGLSIDPDSSGGTYETLIAKANADLRILAGAGFYQANRANILLKNSGNLELSSNSSSNIIFKSNTDEQLRITSAGDVQMTGGTVFLNKHSVGIGTTTQEGRNAGVSTATGTIIYNAETEKVQVYANAVWRNVGSLEPDQSSGFYSSLSAAQAAGLSHYWPGNSSTSLISGLQPDDRKGNPTFNNKEHDGYGATNPFFHFAGQTGGDNPTGYRYTHSEDWVGHSFSITYWVKVMQEITEGESTYVQLGNHSGTRSMFAMSSSGSTTLIGKTITIGDDNANDQIQYEFNNWIHVGVRYNYGANSATYYKNGVQTENHTFNQTLSVGTGNNNIYLGYGYWNSSTSNKESCSRMSDIGIWDSTSINGGNFMEIYKAGRLVKGY